ncbi:MAG: SIS domain-containing protein [Bacteroidetes bacterium]|nr:SIS domain-containing protein [Bacteroidota bacterium]
MSIEDFYVQSLRESAEVKERSIEACRAATLRAIEVISEAYRNGGKVLFCGNGGSAADCQHLATELMIRLNHDIQRPALGAVSLATDPSNMTAGGNDIGFDNVFARNVEGLGRAGDVLVGISTSGRSRNVMAAVQTARTIGMHTICLLGGDGGVLKDACDVPIIVPSTDTQRIQETHIVLGHIICGSVEHTLYGNT